MTDSAETSSFPADADRGEQPGGVPAASPHDVPAASTYTAGAQADGTGPPASSDRPELVVGAAFAGGFLAALILKRIAR